MRLKTIFLKKSRYTKREEGYVNQTVRQNNFFVPFRELLSDVYYFVRKNISNFSLLLKRLKFEKRHFMEISFLA